MSLRTSLALCLFALLGLAGCGSSSGSEKKVVPGEKPKDCSGATYVPFDPANHAAEDQRVEAQVSFRAKIASAVADPTAAPAAFGDIEGLYTSTAGLRDATQALVDDHFPDDPASKSVGSQIDLVITDGIARGKAATKALDVKVAGYIVDEGLSRSFYLSVFHDLVEGTRVTYDEGYGSLGTGPTNDPQAVRSVAALAKEIDALEGTDYGKRLFDDIRAGACVLDEALRAEKSESVDWETDEEYGAVVREIDSLMTEVLALAVAREFTALASEQDLDTAVEELYRGAHYFFTLEAAMRAKGGTAETQAADIAGNLNAVMNDIESGQTTWKSKVDAEAIRDQVAAAFGVKPKG